METGATGGSGAPCNTCSVGAAEIMAIHSLRVMLLLQFDGGADADAIHVYTPAFLGLIYFQGFVRTRRA
jgi:hypothetical protein